MGIRFTCPNGHKLNVKSNLAGRRGWCPHCGVPVEIPLQSTRESSHTKRREGAVEPPESLSNVQKSPATQSESTTTEGPSASQGATHPTTTSSMPARTVGYGEVPSATANAAGIQSAVMASVEVVLNERPNAVWYLHQGESQRGPFLMDSMREFFQNGQIESEAIVWREDWPDWRDVTEVFPTLFPMSAPVPTNATAAPTVASSITPTPVASAAQDFLQNTIQGERGLASPGMAQASRTQKKKSLPINGVTALCIFAVSLLMLGIGACWMLTHNGGDAENTATDEPTPEILTESTESTPTDSAKSIDAAKSTKPIEPLPSAESTESVTPVASEKNTVPLIDTSTVTDTSTTVPTDAESTTTQ